MIKFNVDNKLNWTLLAPELAVTYISFLNQEIARHEVEQAIAGQKAREVMPDNKLLSELWWSAHKRHKQDIVAGEKLIREVTEYFGLE